MAFCFLDSREFPEGTIRGAALVTDERTRPVEFRVTDSVAIGPLQRMLYGDVLDEHVVGDLIGTPLLEALRESIDCVVVRDRRLLDLGSRAPCPVLWVGREDEEAALEIEGGADDDAARQALSRAAERYDLLEPFERVRVALDHVHAQAAGASAGAAGAAAG